MPKLERFPEAHIYQAYGIYLLQSQHRLVRRLRRVYEPSVHGHKTWRASFLLMDYLLHRPIRRGARVMEIGCGWGPGAVFCASRFAARVTGVDMDKAVFPYLDVLAALNGVEVASLNKRFEDVGGSDLEGQEIVVGSDICFWDKMVRPLHQLIDRSLTAGVKRVILTDPGRPPFYDLADRCAKKWSVDLNEWYALEPNRTTGEVLEVKP